MITNQLCVLLLWFRLPAVAGFTSNLGLPFSRTTALMSLAQDSEQAQNHLDNDDDDVATTFADLGLSPTVLSAAQSSWTHPTPIQRLAIPSLLESSSSAWCQAPTGSGKTAAFLLPLLHKLSVQPQKGLRALLLVPTRELAVQVGAVATTLCQNLRGRQEKFNVQVVHGGVPMKPQLADLRYANILIATPGRLVDLLTHNDASSAADASMEQRLLEALNEQGKPNASLSLAQLEKLQQRLNAKRSSGSSTFSPANMLEDLDYLILDEADRLLSPGFEKEMNQLLELMPPSHKETWLFSATFPKRIEPRVDALLQRLHHDDVLRISCESADRATEGDISGQLQKRLDRLSSTTAAPTKSVTKVGPASTINLRTIRLEKPDRTQALRKMLQDNPQWDRVLVFVSTRYAAEHVARKLRRVGIESAELHGKLDQEARLRRLNSLRKGRVRVLLATDVASRGLDVVGLPVVVNYDLPRSTADFVHRIGRTGRAGRPGIALTFVTPDCEAHYELIESRHLKEPVERQVLQGLEPNEEEWAIKSAAALMSVPGADQHSSRGLAHDRMHGGIKGRRKSKKDRLREAAARAAQVGE